MHTYLFISTGFYVPNDMTLPLWDLDSDYYLHNKTLRPPTPYLNKILYEENKLNTYNNGSSCREYISNNMNKKLKNKNLKYINEEETMRRYFINHKIIQQRLWADLTR
jgi:hypothetical protein